MAQIGHIFLMSYDQIFFYIRGFVTTAERRGYCICLWCVSWYLAWSSMAWSSCQIYTFILAGSSISGSCGDQCVCGLPPHFYVRVLHSHLQSRAGRGTDSREGRLVKLIFGLLSIAWGFINWDNLVSCVELGISTALLLRAHILITQHSAGGYYDQN